MAKSTYEYYTGKKHLAAVERKLQKDKEILGNEIDDEKSQDSKNDRER